MHLLCVYVLISWGGPLISAVNVLVIPQLLDSECLLNAQTVWNPLLHRVKSVIFAFSRANLDILSFKPEQEFIRTTRAFRDANFLERTRQRHKSCFGRNFGIRVCLYFPLKQTWPPVWPGVVTCVLTVYHCAATRFSKNFWSHWEIPRSSLNVRNAWSRERSKTKSDSGLRSICGRAPSFSHLALRDGVRRLVPPRTLWLSNINRPSQPSCSEHWDHS